MSRAGYTEDGEDNWGLIRWRGQVASAIRGKRGQALLRDLVAALDAMPEKALVTEELETKEGNVCALGAVGRMRGAAIGEIDTEDWEALAQTFGIAEPLAREVMYENDEGAWQETPEQRWKRMRAWAVSKIRTRLDTTVGPDVQSES